MLFRSPSTFAPILAPDPAKLKQGMKLKFSLIERGGAGDTAGKVGFAYVPDAE